MAAGRRRASRKRWSPFEREAREGRGPLIAGIDEVGRGPLAGPVVACAVIMPPDVRAIGGVDDSKALSAAERLRLALKIRERAVAVGLGAASVREIDRVNIYHATVLAMRRALGRLGMPPDHILVDGKEIRSLAIPHTAIVGGDRRCYSIACASILAKVTRDRLMIALARRYPNYLWDRNVGYGTPEHWSRVFAHGMSPHHRLSFVKARQLSLDLETALPADVIADAMTPTPAIVRPDAEPDDLSDDLPYIPERS
ncbi:MAG: ribonuclease HII [Gemmatimonadaceae bacterium]|nr:ribonuclease HII [Gemmatimonadaceae bacterium]NUQ92817.1 ribonuclease HII [Gemmatimonadaceae bacterium]NUR21218.1 ribonuclease HII [Gemmatimonadaceae bacterium]